MLLQDPQYHVLIRSQKAGNGGPDQYLLEITHEVKNLVWQKTLNLPGNAAFTLMKDSPILPQFDYMNQHIEIYRQDSNGTELIFRGKIVQPDYGPNDVVVLCWDYMAFLQRMRVDYYLNKRRKRYSRKRMGVIVKKLWNTTVKDDSILRFVRLGIIQNPKGDDDSTYIRTGNHFGIAGLQDLMQIYYDICEMSMSNTDNTTVIEIDEYNKLNFIADRRKDNDYLALSHPGNVEDFGYSEAWGNSMNDLATLVRNDDKPTGKKQITFDKDGGNTGIDAIRRVQGSAQLGTLLGISKGTKYKGKKVLALRRMARTAARIDQLMTVTPHEGVFSGWPTQFELGQNLYLNLKKDASRATSGYFKLISIVGGWGPEGETIQMGFREKDVPD